MNEATAIEHRIAVNSFTARPVYQGDSGYTGSLVMQVQLRLARAGYYHGLVDGVSGNGTRRAVREYEHAHGLPEDGKIRQQLLTAIGLGLRSELVFNDKGTRARQNHAGR